MDSTKLPKGGSTSPLLVHCELYIKPSTSECDMVGPLALIKLTMNVVAPLLVTDKKCCMYSN